MKCLKEFDKPGDGEVSWEAVEAGKFCLDLVLLMGGTAGIDGIPDDFGKRKKGGICIDDECEPYTSVTLGKEIEDDSDSDSGEKDTHSHAGESMLDTPPPEAAVRDGPPLTFARTAAESGQLKRKHQSVPRISFERPPPVPRKNFLGLTDGQSLELMGRLVEIVENPPKPSWFEEKLLEIISKNNAANENAGSVDTGNANTSNENAVNANSSKANAGTAATPIRTINHEADWLQNALARKEARIERLEEQIDRLWEEKNKPKDECMELKVKAMMMSSKADQA
ncbi:hypothetical protein FPQ18DRAFT_414366 [Pyronema domesticum]|uniref:Uncharacterized protein n=1 Tax=Pyronema omphalodes (strain CBS 100304) TaxID=1076935 RepID=U4KZJ1_PYROM|nr:hypothetical protein FPQ18DRAFT_414366 [Pyronema domesticum]CCX05114.1 Protein of unknown function [Pyronema omphalodes CBS 100304]